MKSKCLNLYGTCKNQKLNIRIHTKEMLIKEVKGNKLPNSCQTEPFAIDYRTKRMHCTRLLLKTPGQLKAWWQFPNVGIFHHFPSIFSSNQSDNTVSTCQLAHPLPSTSRREHAAPRRLHIPCLAPAEGNVTRHAAPLVMPHTHLYKQSRKIHSGRAIHTIHTSRRVKINNGT